MEDQSNFHENLAYLTKKQIEDALPHRSFSRAQKRSRAALKEAVDELPEEDRDAIIHAARRIKRQRSEEGVDPVVMAGSVEPDQFFETVTEELRQERIAKFIDATGNDAMKTGECAICAGMFHRREMSSMSMDDLRETKKIEPIEAHPAHILTDGMLLHNTPDSVFTTEGGQPFARTCGSCQSSIEKKKMPGLSLANGMWIGDIPLELKVLTLPERILIARHFPAAYIVKLFPKKKGARNWAARDGLHSALQGNVSTYRLNTTDVALMTQGNMMPPPSQILAATIGVTFVGPSNLPEKTLPGDTLNLLQAV